MTQHGWMLPREVETVFAYLGLSNPSLHLLRSAKCTIRRATSAGGAGVQGEQECRGSRSAGGAGVQGSRSAGEQECMGNRSEGGAGMHGEHGITHRIRCLLYLQLSFRHKYHRKHWRMLVW